jgi:tRNA pseudouridine32 synthase/23S rRNA pseudouridine746 synthase
MPLEDEFVYNPPQTGLCVIHMDNDLLVLSKPSGLLSVPGRREDCKDSLQSRVEAAFPEALLVHRLDMETSGIFLMARNKAAQRHLGLQFERRQMQKTYIARVWGQVEGESGEIDLPLRCYWERRPLQMVCFDDGKPAKTHWQVLSRDTISTRVKLTPHTGRTHQLRVHMLELGRKAMKGGHPILGDDFYAHPDAHKAAPRLQLHAQELELHHPTGGERITITDICDF